MLEYVLIAFITTAGFHTEVRELGSFNHAFDCNAAMFHEMGRGEYRRVACETFLDGSIVHRRASDTKIVTNFDGLPFYNPPTRIILEQQ